jgi:hypothetical protein
MTEKKEHKKRGAKPGPRNGIEKASICIKTDKPNIDKFKAFAKTLDEERGVKILFDSICDTLPSLVK